MEIALKTDGVVLVDKAPEMTSFQVVRAIKQLFNNKKVGHTGTLDPIATGLLPICLGRATKLAGYISNYRKVYDVWMRFGIATDSHDRTGQTLDEKPWQHIDAASIKAALPHFMGDIKQVPPMFSAVKMQGRPLYWYAHQGITIANRKERDCTIYRFELLEWQAPRARFLIESSHGTYVRSLVHDLAIQLKSAGMVEELRRLSCGQLTLDHAVSLATLQTETMSQRQARIMSMSQALPQLPTYQLPGALVERVRSGRTIMWSDLQRDVNSQQMQNENTELFKLTTGQGELIALAAWAGDQLLSNRAVRTVKIF